MSVISGHFLYIIFGWVALTAVWSSDALAKSYTVQELTKLYIERSYALQASRARRERFQNEVDVAKARFFPSVALVGRASDDKTPLSSFGIPGLSGFSEREAYSTSFELEQPLYLGGQIWRGYDLRKAQKKLAEWRFLQEKRQDLARFLQDVMRMKTAEEQIEVLRESQRTQKKFLVLTRRRRQKGIARTFELRQAEADYYSYAPRLEEFSQIKSSLEELLRQQLELEGDFVVDWVEEESDGVALPEERFLLNLVRTKHPQYRAAEIEIQMAEIQKTLNLGADRPSVSLSASWGWQSPELKGIGRDESEARSLAVNLKVPIFSGLSSLHVKRAAEKSIYSAQKHARVILQRLSAEIRNSRRGLVVRQRQLEQNRKWSLAAKAALDEGLKSYRVGVIGSVQLNQLQAAHERAALSFIQAKESFRQGRLVWHLSAGNDLEEIYKGKMK